MVKKFTKNTFIGQEAFVLPLLLIVYHLYYLYQIFVLAGARTGSIKTKFFGKVSASSIRLGLIGFHVFVLAAVILLPLVTKMGAFSDVSTIQDETSDGDEFKGNLHLDDPALDAKTVASIDKLFKDKNIVSLLKIENEAAFKSCTTVRELNQMIVFKRFGVSTIGAAAFLGIIIVLVHKLKPLDLSTSSTSTSTSTSTTPLTRSTTRT
jgi:hypothetical protein